MASTAAKKQKLKLKPDDENPLRPTENHGSDEPLVVDADAKASSLKAIKGVMGALSYLGEMIQKDTAVVSTRHNTLGVARSDLRELGRILGAEADTEQENELRLQLLRAANMENHRLRDEMGKGVTIESIGLKLYQLDRTIYNWWQNLGFTYSKSSIQAHSQGASFQVEFSVGVERHISTMEPKPVTAKAKLDAKRVALGKELQIVYEGSEPHVLDNPNNRAWITNTLKARFPRCRIWKWESISIHRSDEFQLRHVEVNIDMTDVGDIVEERDV